ncbi:hypothetical protein CDL15_Pgr016932 [Punica granatum]|uniref:Uncharacterized protein n=1 Tax=Punica granatum TaxID=22663 RepID=A0A218WXV2_PUNGR|nr:hypothetical protein CDL15_Pgr016932 [Punica granatum]PKI74749.1 hypothetical protein CRG98_004858 [Punica granatum]
MGHWDLVVGRMGRWAAVGPDWAAASGPDWIAAAWLGSWARALPREVTERSRRERGIGQGVRGELETGRGVEGAEVRENGRVN